MQTLERLVDEECQRDGVAGEVEMTDKRRRGVDVRHGQTLTAEDNVGKHCT